MGPRRPLGVVISLEVERRRRGLPASRFVEVEPGQAVEGLAREQLRIGDSIVIGPIGALGTIKGIVCDPSGAAVELRVELGYGLMPTPATGGAA